MQRQRGVGAFSFPQHTQMHKLYTGALRRKYNPGHAYRAFQRFPGNFVQIFYKAYRGDAYKLS